MNRQKQSKINQLLASWPANTVATYPCLEQQGISRQLLSAYKKSGWIRSVGQGAYARLNEDVDWMGALYAIQEQLRLNVHAGGKTALQLKGYAHFLPMGKQSQVFLFGSSATKLPSWFQKYDWAARIEYAMTNLFSGTDAGLTKYEQDTFAISISTPERAIMELLYLVTQKQSFEEAGQLMEGLTTLRPTLVSELLERCNSVKVKRLFLFLAEYYNHSWVSELNVSKVDLGSGKRLVVKTGCFDKKYGITIPKSFCVEEGGSI
ncbi:MAG: hypothetical protein BWY40_01229 [bacterium ADurb.Bin270]|nr:MAG: hypothetical protein BWY40_01229 [bacterium ADurb.Bin270]